MGRKEDDDKYQEFLREPDEEKEFRDKVLRPGVVHGIHLNRDAEDAESDPIDLTNYYTKAQIDALFAAFSGGLPTCFTDLVRHDFLVYDEINECWKNMVFELDFEDSIDYTVTNMWGALIALIRIEDTLAGGGLILEDTL